MMKKCRPIQCSSSFLMGGGGLLSLIWAMIAIVISCLHQIEEYLIIFLSIVQCIITVLEWDVA